ncbi:hypothetical protein RHEC894_PC00087 (plasmid) [Rhizobium sp. CIAT894]|uniref:hypothetical protein n=1 Tax=Rhizobium sp. CIAT894 TaxID=2020312 RepID=UPI000A1DB56E|nr:hypothetical protein [Rhizobium sp. CIAT894]ARM91122.1 hypothetical protein RHEC894_PC00087 [Rhizobium sp. CIAT894]
MSASLIFDIVPIGSIVAWSDGAPPPPKRHRKKLSAWKTRNSQGRLIRKQEGRRTGSYVALPEFTIHENDFGSAGTIALRVFRTFAIDSDLTFTVVERPATGSVRVFDRPGERAELVHLAANRAAAEAWLKQHGYPEAVVDEVTAYEAQAEIAKGRDAA